MIIIYISISTFIIFSAYKLFLNDEISFDFFLIWSFCGISLLLITLFPAFFGALRDLLWLGKRKENFIIILSIIGLFLLIMRLSVKVSKGAKQQEKIARTQALLTFQIKNKGINTQKNKILVKIAAFNEEENIGDVLEAMPKGVDVLVIDDGSSDNTVDKALEFGALVIRHPVRLGQGSADVTGFKYAFMKEYDFVVEMDGDGQHDPADIPRFINTLQEGNADIVTGSRVTGSNHPDNSPLRNFFLPYYTKLINYLTGYSLTDGMCGFKAFRMQTLIMHKNIYDQVIETQYLASELYIRFAHRQLSVVEIPIHIDTRKSGTSRKGTLRYGIQVIKIMVRVWMIEKLLLRSKERHVS